MALSPPQHVCHSIIFSRASAARISFGPAGQYATHPLRFGHDAQGSFRLLDRQLRFHIISHFLALPLKQQLSAAPGIWPCRRMPKAARTVAISFTCPGRDSCRPFFLCRSAMPYAFSDFERSQLFRRNGPPMPHRSAAFTSRDILRMRRGRA